MSPKACPAAYIRGSDSYLARACPAVADQAAQRGWPAAELYIDAPSASPAAPPALARLHAAITRDRHTRLLIAVPVLCLRPDSDLIALLRACTRHGVITGIVLPAAPTIPVPAFPDRMAVLTAGFLSRMKVVSHSAAGSLFASR